MNYVYYSPELNYPSDIFNYSPSVNYPEYPFSETQIAGEVNLVYAAIREMFHSMHLDEDNYGKPEWNPLGVWIKPGQNVVLKPNFVMHKNGSGDPEDLNSLVTHPSVIRCVLDYCQIALKNRGSVIVGDAPVKDCDFALLMKKRNYSCIIDFYKNNGITIDFVDFRGPEEEGGQYKDAGNGILINLGEKSWFYNSSYDENKYRVPNYDNKKVIRHHQGKVQEYLLNSVLLEADVVINLPKPKTHRKNGYTGGLKNFVGINYSKEYLPHHTQGAVSQGGDEFKNSGIMRTAVSVLRLSIDKNRIRIDESQKKSSNKAWRRILGVYHKVLWNTYDTFFAWDMAWMKYRKKSIVEQAREGCWYGNDTLWRTVLDLYYCIIYAGPDGRIKNTKQRTVIHLGDMVVSGECEGPMAPSPKEQHMLLFSENAVEFDCILTKIMGFDYKKFKGLDQAVASRALLDSTYDEINVRSNISECCGLLKGINFSNIASPFKPALGWINHVESEELRNETNFSKEHI